MQGRRGNVGSLPEVLNFDHGSTPSASVLDQRIHWNDIHNQGDNGLEEYMFPLPVYRGHSSVNRWDAGEASSSGTKNELSHNEQLPEHVNYTTLEQQQQQKSDNLNGNPLFVQCSVPDPVSQGINLNASFINHGDGAGPLMAHPSLYKSAGQEFDRVSSAKGSEYSLAENSNRSGRKRKAIAAVVGRSSPNLGCSEFQRGESSTWTAEPECYPMARGISISSPIEQANPRHETCPNPINGHASHRNVRMRMNPPNQQEVFDPSLFSAGSVVRHPGVSSLQQNPGVVPINHPWDWRSEFPVNNVGSLSQNGGAHAQGLPRTVQPFSWNGSPIPNTCVPRDAARGNETRPRNIPRNMVESPFFMPAPQPRTRNAASRSSTTGNILPGNILSGSRAGSSTGVPPQPNLSYAQHSNNHALYSRRFSELVRRSLLSSLGAESGGIQSGDASLFRSSTNGSLEGVAVSSGTGNMGHHQSYPRTASWSQRQGNVPGIPHPLRALAASNGGRNRLVVSEIRNVLEMMRRGENMRFEDIMILDPSVFYGMADIHDRHRDLRLDVDNMSYEELLALEERIGDVCTGLSEEIVTKRLKQQKHCAPAIPTQEAEPCCICQEEYNDGDALGTLECGHDFHSDCIKQWLMRKNLCPICKTTGLNTTETKTG